MERVAVIGLGYVGLPLAVALARTTDTIGLDIDQGRLAQLRAGHDRTGELTADKLAASPLRYTSDIADAADADVMIVTVPTPVDADNNPDLGAVLGATRSLASVLRPGAGTIIVYESTVYPGVTEDVCGPEIERVSGLRRGVDFFLGYSPERINPGDTENTVDKIVKVVSGENPEVLETLAALYGRVTSAGVYRAASIKAAEAAKVIENAQRDINIAFVNEITQIFSRLGLSVYDVLDAAGTKWNFLNFRPGLVGGHCIGVDPFYLSHVATRLGLDPRVILAGRSTNDGMGAWIADQIHAQLSVGEADPLSVGASDPNAVGQADPNSVGSTDPKAGASVLVLGLTFKENVPDLRNSRVVDVIRRLESLGHEVTVHDPLADPAEAMHEYGLELASDFPRGRFDAVVAAVPHQAYRDMDFAEIAAIVGAEGLVADIKGLWKAEAKDGQARYWSL